MKLHEGAKILASLLTIRIGQLSYLWFHYCLDSYMIPIPSAALPVTTLDHLFAGAANIHSSYQVSVNGITLTPGAIQRLAGCPAGGEVFVSVTTQKITLVSTHSTLIDNARGMNTVEIRRDAKGYYLYADYIWYAESAPKGLGGVALLLMAHQAHALGLPRIDLLAAGGSGIKHSGQWSQDFWGYVAWPMMGFETALQPPILNLIQTEPHLVGCTHISEVVTRDIDWWKKHGDGWEMTFDLTPGSQAWDTLYHFCLNRGLI